MRWCGLCGSKGRFTITQNGNATQNVAVVKKVEDTFPVVTPPKPADPLPPLEVPDAPSEPPAIVVTPETDDSSADNKSEDLTDNKSEDLADNKSEDLATAQEERRAGVIPITSNYTDTDLDKIEKHPKDERDKDIIRKAIEQNEFLHKIIKVDLMEECIDAMYNCEINANQVLITEGESGNHMYVSAKGQFEITTKAGFLLVFNNPRVFGELAILYNEKRNATIRALKEGRVWVLNREVYQKLRLRFEIKEQDEMLEFLKKVPQLSFVGDRLQKVASLLKVEFFNPGEAIVTQGEKGDKFYIIRVGTVSIIVDNNKVGTREKGQFFGELALLGEDTRKATVVANDPGVECYTLLRQYFLDHIDVENSGFQINKPEEFPKPVAEYSDVPLSEWKIETTLGIGGFGRVELVKHRSNPQLICALKYLKKVDMVEQNQQEHVLNERKLQMSCQSKFIVRLYRSYSDRKYIYFLMESCLGGDLWTSLQRQPSRRFEEPDARFIAACILEAFAYLHERDIVYRDLKPENILIDKNGYMKLTDFGFAKKLDKGRTYTFAGTPEYVAPEILLNKGHDKAVDYWAFGIFIYELLVGKTPFRTNDVSHMKTYNKIMKGIESVEFPKVVPSKARSIIEKLCKQIPSERLGCQKNGVKDIKENRWFLGFDWDKLNAGKITSSFKPKLKSITDTRNFDKFQKDTDIPPDDPTDWAKDF